MWIRAKEVKWPIHKGQITLFCADVCTKSGRPPDSAKLKQTKTLPLLLPFLNILGFHLESTKISVVSPVSIPFNRCTLYFVFSFHESSSQSFAIDPSSWWKHDIRYRKEKSNRQVIQSNDLNVKWIACFQTQNKSRLRRFILRVTQVVDRTRNANRANHEELCSESSSFLLFNCNVFWRRDHLGDKGRCLWT